MTNWLMWAGIAAGLYLIVVVVGRALDGWLGQEIEKALTKHESPFLWNGVGGSAPPRGHRACRDCGYFFPADDLDREAVCYDCRTQDSDIAALMDYGYEYDAVPAEPPCEHNVVGWTAGGPVICVSCRVEIDRDPDEEWDDLIRAIEDEERER